MESNTWYLKCFLGGCSYVTKKNMTRIFSFKRSFIYIDSNESLKSPRNEVEQVLLSPFHIRENWGFERFEKVSNDSIFVKLSLEGIFPLLPTFLDRIPLTGVRCRNCALWDLIPMILSTNLSLPWLTVLYVKPV